MQKRHRIFIAINLPPEVKGALAKYPEKFPDLPARWTDFENIHITISFVGYVTGTQLGEICMAVKEVVENHNVFELNFNKVVYGPADKKVPTMVWLSGEKSKELSLLKRDIEGTLEKSIGFKPEIKSWSPHITLARLTMMEFRALDLEERPEINEDVDIQFEVPVVEVMESELKKEGPVYTVIESHQLK